MGDGQRNEFVADNGESGAGSNARITERVTVAANVTKAIQDGKAAMALADKLRLVAEKSRTVPAKVEARIDSILARYDALDTGSEETCNGLGEFLKPHEDGLAELENAHKELKRGSNT